MKELLFLIMLLHCLHGNSWTLTLGAYKPDQKVQDSNGSEKTDQTSPFLNVGWYFPVKYSWFPDFAPRIGYIMNKNSSDDFYSSYKTETYTILYDFLYQPKGWKNISLRYGVGSFIQKISGGNGPVTVPNGNSTITAYKPGTSKSATMTLNGGVDFEMGATKRGYLKDYGFSLQLFHFNPGGKASFLAYQAGITGYF